MRKSCRQNEWRDQRTHIRYSRSIEKVLAHSSCMARHREEWTNCPVQVYAYNKPVYELLSEHA